MSDIRAYHLPYCLERQADGRYVILNRRYKPVGFTTRERVDYGAYPIAVKFKRLTRATAARLSVRGSEDLEKIWLYDDATVPTASARNMQQYLDRLKVLMSLKVDTSE
jgi:hypothetical protein